MQTSQSTPDSGSSPVFVEKSDPLPSIYDKDEFINKHFSTVQEEIDVQNVIWEINSWSGLPHKVQSPEVICGGYKWRMLIFPRGNQPNSHAMSFFAEVVPPEDADESWYVCAEFILLMANPHDPHNPVLQKTEHRFHKSETDWGYSKFVDNKTNVPINSQHEFIENDKVILGLYVRVVNDPTGVLWHTFNNYDSKKTTGCVGINNQGATCYMNSLLQSLFFTNFFRKAVFQIPTENDDPNKSVALALQRVFYNLQNSSQPVGTTELTRSFGWDTIDSFMQHDVQEFNRVLQDNLEGKMKGTAAEGAIQKLFVGKMKSYITCTEVKYESSRSEDYYDIQLNVKGCKDVRESFERYIEVEMLNGENKYMAEGFGLQDAKKGVIFESFPPVLHLQLKRFDYDMIHDAMIKINDRYEFPESIDLSDFLAEDADKSESHEYVLHGVLVHSGDLHGGHYFALLKPNTNAKWLKFDDDRVVPATKTEVFDDNFGGDNGYVKPTLPYRNNPRYLKRFSNAYMLVYIRKSRISEILADVTEKEIPSHLSTRLNHEIHEADELKKKKRELSQQINLWILTEDVLKEHRSFGLFNLRETTLPVTPFQSLKFNKDRTFGDLKNQLANQLGTISDDFRLWLVGSRNDNTYRVNRLLDVPDNTVIDSMCNDIFDDRNANLLYMEPKENTVLSEPFAPSLSSEMRLLMVKYYNYRTNSICYLGKIYLSDKTSIAEIAQKFQPFVMDDPDHPLEVFEECKDGTVEHMTGNLPISDSELVDGDIIILKHDTSNAPEPVNTVEALFQKHHDDVRVIFKFKSAYNRPDLDTNPPADLPLVINRDEPYESFIEKLGQALGVDPLTIRLHTVYHYRNEFQPISYVKDTTLAQINPSVQQDFTLYYEILPESIVEFEAKTTILLSVFGATMKEETPINVRVYKKGTVQDLLNEVTRILVEGGTQLAGELKIYQVDNHKFAGYLNSETVIEDLELYMTFCVETVHDAPPGDEDINVSLFHYAKDAYSATHGIPFVMVKRKDDTFATFKKKLFDKLGLTEKEAQKVQIGYLVRANYSSKVMFIQDESDWEALAENTELELALEHPDRSHRTTRYSERSIKIFN